MKIIHSAHRAAQNNKGSAILTVVVSMLFIVALGSALLFAAYTGYKISLTERGNKANFYAGSEVVDDIRTGIQNSVTESLALAYTASLKKYATADETYDPQSEFAYEFIRQLSQITVRIGGVDTLLFSSAEQQGRTAISGYYPAALQSYTTAPDESVTLGYDGTFYSSGYGKVVETTDAYGSIVSVTMEEISVKYIENGYEADIITDITITIPDFFAKTPISESINNCAVVAEEMLSQSSGGAHIVISGDIYAGEISVTGADNKLTFTEGDVICKGNIDVFRGAGLIFNAPKNELWANEIAVGTAAQGGNPATIGTLDLNGMVYVSDDLAMEGNNGSSAKLQGSYFGFGDGSSSNTSSAILINGRGSELDISELDKLSLAGVSFINISGENFTTDGGDNYSVPIPMGESISVKSNQLAYLVPAECISNYPTNPCIFESSVTAPQCDLDNVLWGTKTLSDYLNDGKGEIKALYKNLDAQSMKVAYVFLVFENQEYANAYFRDYFVANPEKIENYLNIYVDISDISSSAYFDTAGNIFYTDNYGHSPNDDTLTLRSASEKVWTAGIKTRFGRMDSPFGDFVNEEALSSLEDNTELNFVKDGKTVAVITTNDDYNYSTYSDSLQIIISANNVSIKANFNGIILAKGEVKVSSGITAKGIDSSILEATCGQYTLSDFVFGGLSTEGTGSDTSKNSWSPDKLVVYENWTKN